MSNSKSEKERRKAVEKKAVEIAKKKLVFEGDDSGGSLTDEEEKILDKAGHLASVAKAREELREKREKN